MVAGIGLGMSGVDDGTAPPERPQDWYRPSPSGCSLPLGSERGADGSGEVLAREGIVDADSTFVERYIDGLREAGLKE